MASEYHEDLTEHWIVRFLLTDTLRNAQNLLNRFRDVDYFRHYVTDRTALVIPTMLVIFLISIGCVLGIVALIPDLHFLLVLPAIVLSAVVLVGSLFVQAFVFFSWIEGRSLNQALGHRHEAAPGPLATWLLKKFRLDMRPVPPVPWIMSVFFLIMPVIMLAYVWTGAALIIAAIALLVPILYARFDR